MSSTVKDIRFEMFAYRIIFDVENTKKRLLIFYEDIFIYKETEKYGLTFYKLFPYRKDLLHHKQRRKDDYYHLLTVFLW